MTPTEIRDSLRLLAGRIGGDAGIDVSIRPNGSRFPIEGVIYPFGITKSTAIRIQAEDWPEAVTLLNERWNDSRDGLQAQTIKTMALAIIRLTDEHGECTDQMLRAEFDAGDVTAFMDRAIERADTMASNGPFSVRRVSQSNAA